MANIFEQFHAADEVQGGAPAAASPAAVASPATSLNDFTPMMQHRQALHQTRRAGGDSPGTARSAAQGLSLGFASELEGIFNRQGNETVSQAQTRIRRELGDFQKRHSGIALGTELLASIALPGGIAVKAGAKLAGAGGGMVRQSLGSMAVGAAEGAAARSPATSTPMAS